MECLRKRTPRTLDVGVVRLGIASLANIGGMASAPMLAAAYSRTLIPVGVIMALIGSFLGTYFGMLVGKILGIM